MQWRAPCGSPEACPQARARDERGAGGTDANRLGRMWLQKVPGCHESYCSYNYVRIESVGEDVAAKSARVSCGCVRDDATRVSVQDRSWRAVAHVASGCHDIVLWTRSPVSTTKRVTLRAPVSIRFVPSHSHAMVIRGWWIRRHDTRTPSSHTLPSRFRTYAGIAV